MKYNFCKILKSTWVLSLSLSSSCVYAMEAPERSASMHAMEAPEEEDWGNFFQTNREVGANLSSIHDTHKRTNEAQGQNLVTPSGTEVKKTKKEGEVMETSTIIADDQSVIIASLCAEERAEQFLLMKEKNYPLAIQALLDAEVFAAYDPSRRCALNRKIGDLYFQLNEGDASIKQAVKFYAKATYDNINPIKKSYLFERVGDLTRQLTMPDENSFKAIDYYRFAISEINKAIEIARNDEKKSVLFEKKAELAVKLNDNKYSSQAADAYNMAISLTSDKERKYELLFAKAKLISVDQGEFSLLEACETYHEAAAMLAEQGQYTKAAKVSYYGVSLIKDINNSFFPHQCAEMMLKSAFYHYRSASLKDCHEWLNLSYSHYKQITGDWDWVDKIKIVYLYNFAYLAAKLELQERAIGALDELKALAELYDFKEDHVETIVGKIEVNKLKQGESLLSDLASQ